MKRILSPPWLSLLLSTLAFLCHAQVPNHGVALPHFRPILPPMTAVDPRFRRDMQGWHTGTTPRSIPTGLPDAPELDGDQGHRRTECGYVSENPFDSPDAEALVCVGGLACSTSSGFVGCCRPIGPCDIATTCVEYNSSTTVSACGHGTICCGSTRPVCNYLAYRDIQDAGMIHCETKNLSPGVLYNTYNPFADRNSANETETAIGEPSIGANTARGPTSKPSRTTKYKKCMIIVGGVMGGLVLLGGVLRLGQRCKTKRAFRRRQSSSHIDAERPRLMTRQTAPASLGTAAMSHLAPTGDMPSGVSPQTSSFFPAVDSLIVQTSLAPGFMALNMTEAAYAELQSARSSSVGRGFQRMMGRKPAPFPVESVAMGAQGHHRTFPHDAGGRLTVVEGA
ncbi:hypothetical protein B0T18DRAFT_491909 [Schizothecium vesticola]|uniref:Mid2 domain-containing protein n=1 Tax=Schizothecium vesticola TaxID=314040 RepID=A0AA40BNX8_9PEZI|nr:hypothetical protein B0T18DRAFT_491909 [Schizothecium vesticola]